MGTPNFDISNKKDATRWLYRIYRIVDKHDITVVIDRRLAKDYELAQCNYFDDGTLRVRIHPDQPEKGGFLSSLIHEFIHAIGMVTPYYSRLVEDEILVRYMEGAMIQLLSDRQLTNLMGRLAPLFQPEFREYL